MVQKLPAAFINKHLSLTPNRKTRVKVFQPLVTFLTTNQFKTSFYAFLLSDTLLNTENGASHL
jgi:hypothetical protein